MPPYRVLGLTARATNAEIKAAYKKLAMKWHPDAHHGAAKAQAEEKFKTILGAYQALTGVGGAQQQQQQQQQQYYYDVASRRRGRTARGGHNWGSAEAFGHAGNPHESYMGFGPGGKHWCARPLWTGHIHRKHRRPCPSRPGVRRYEDTQAAASKTEQRHKVVMWTCIGVFAFGLWAVQSSSASDKAAKERGELVDAWYNQTTRRWETPRQHMYKDAMLSSLIMLKPPAQVYKPNQSFAGESRASQPKLARTLSGVALADAYRQRQTGSRSGA